MLGNTALAMERTEPRYDVCLAIYYGIEQQRLMANYTVNMSLGGIFIETDTLLPVETPLVVDFLLPDNDTLISCKSRVAWTNEPGHLRSSTLPTGMGVQFLDLSLKNIRAIRDFLHKGNLVPTW